MRISVKIAPGVRVSGRVGGRHHHRHHTTYRRTTSGPWMRTIPPWRLGPGSGLGWLIAAVLFLELWMLEFEIWLMVWACYGMFLAARWCWRHNPIGQTVDSVAAARERSRPAPYDPHGAPPEHIDLGQFRR